MGCPSGHVNSPRIPGERQVAEAGMRRLTALGRALLAPLRRDSAALEARLDERIAAQLAKALRRTTEDGGPNLEPLPFSLRDLHNMRWDIKVLGAALAQLLYADGHGDAAPASPYRVPLTGKLCCQSDIGQPWFRYWCVALRMAPLFHRKVWEMAFVLQALWEGGMLTPGRSGLGFAVGQEPLPAYFAGQDVDVLATDLDAADDRALAWSGSAQHAASLDQLFFPALVDRARFDLRCRYQPVDMNRIPDEFAGRFDFCWSMCSLEHLGSIANGLDFIANSLRCLKPGGLAVHTTEFNLDGAGETIDQWPTVLFQRRHIEALAERLAASGHSVAPIDYDPGSGVLDGFVDLPPYPGAADAHMTPPNAPHLRLSVDGFPVTSIGLIIRAAE